MSAVNLANYEASRQRLLDALGVREVPGALPHPVRDFWGTSVNNPDIHHKIIATFRHEDFTFLLSHMEKGTIHTGCVPENLILHCIAGRFLVTDHDGRRELIAAPYSFLVLANEEYTYEAQEEVYNIAKVKHGTS